MKGDFLRSTAVPAMKYAVAVAGLASVVAIVLGFRLKPEVAVIRRFGSGTDVCCRDFLKLYRLEGSRDDGELLKTGIEVSQATVAK